MACLSSAAIAALMLRRCRKAEMLSAYAGVMTGSLLTRSPHNHGQMRLTLGLFVANFRRGYGVFGAGAGVAGVPTAVPARAKRSMQI